MGLITFLLIPLLLVIFTGPVAASIFIGLLKRDNRLAQLIFWLVLVAATIVLGLFIAYTFSNFLPGPGCFVTFFTPPSVIIIFLLFRHQAKRFYQIINNDQRRRHWFLVATILIPLLQLSTPVIGFGFSWQCNALNRQIAQPIIAALETYKNKNGQYPILPGPYHSDLQILVPQYLSAIPSRACVLPFPISDPYGADDNWDLYFCNNSPGQDTLLLVPIIGSDSQQIYNLKTDRWSAGNEFDGYCP